MSQPEYEKTGRSVKHFSTVLYTPDVSAGVYCKRWEESELFMQGNGLKNIREGAYTSRVGYK
jgi:hypothetical protein